MFHNHRFYIKNIRVKYLDSMFQKNMENVSLSIKEEIADETKYGSSSLHPKIGVLEEDSSQVNMGQIRSISFRFLLCTFFIASFAISQSSCRSMRCPASCL
jgi:hypothetical protein